MNGVRDTGQHRADLAAGTGAAADLLDHLAQRRAHDHLADAAVRRVEPVTVHTIVPGDSSVPSVRNQSAPRAMMRGDVGERLDVVDQRRRRVGVAVGTGHLDVGRQAAAGADVGRRLDDLVARPAGTAARCAGTDSGRRSSRAARSPRRRGTRSGLRRRSISTPSAQPAAVDLVDRGRRRAPTSAANERFVATMIWSAPTARARDQRALDHLVRIVPQDRAVLEGARLTFGRVDDHRGALEVGAVVAHGAPLAAGREARRRRGPAGPEASMIGDELVGRRGPGRRRDRVPPRAFTYSSSDVDRRRKQHPVHKRHARSLPNR